MRSDWMRGLLWAETMMKDGKEELVKKHAEEGINPEFKKGVKAYLSHCTYARFIGVEI